MNKNQETKKIRVSNGQELITKAKEYKNSGGEWKLQERYFAIHSPEGKKGKGWVYKNNLEGIKISNGEKIVDIFLEDLQEINKYLANDWEKSCQLFPELAESMISWENEGSRRNKLYRSSYKHIKEKEVLLHRQLVAKNFRHLKLIIRNYFRENEAKIYNSSNRRFANWVKIIDGQDGNMYLYVGEKNADGGREIEIGINKNEFYKKENRSVKEKHSLEVLWDLLIINADQPLTPAERENSYRNLAKQFKKQWPHREKLCRKYWENVAERMKEAIIYQEMSSENQEIALQLTNDRLAIISELLRNEKIKTCCDRVSEKSQIRQYFLQNKIDSITLDSNENLVIEYKSNKENEVLEVKADNALQNLIKQVVSQKNNRSLNFSELETKTDSATSNPNNNKLYKGLTIGGTVGLVIFLMGYLTVKRKRK